MSSSEAVDLLVVEAQSEQARAIAGVITEAAIWRQKEFGFNDWEIPFPEEFILESMAIGKVLVGEVSDQVVATLTLNESDPAVWGEQLPNALYVSKFAIATSMHGRKAGSQMLAKAEAVAAGAGKRYLRLEFNSSNAGLRQHYVNLGFHTKRIKRMNCCYTAARYERPVT